jgi:hypothetical protein
MAVIDFIVEIPTSNAIKLTLDGSVANNRGNVDDIRYYEGDHATLQQRAFLQPFEKTDPLRLQYYTNFLLARIRIVDCDDNEYGSAQVPTLAITYRGKKYRSAAKFASLEGKLFIYFQEGLEYEDEDFIVPGDLVNWSGRLPNIRAQVGDELRYKIGVDFEGAVVEELRWNPALQAEGFLTDIDSAIVNPIDGLVEITYNEKDGNLYQRLISLASIIEDGIYYIKLEFGITDYTAAVYTSEPLDIRTLHEDSLALKYWHEGEFDLADLWGYVYLSDWFNLIRLPATFFQFRTAGEIEADVNDGNIPRMLRAAAFREMLFRAINIPSWLADKLQLVFGHDHKELNEYEWENENFGTYELINDRIDLGNYEIALRQVDDRTTYKKGFQQTLTATFTPPSFSAIPFAGDEVSALFNTNSGVPFRFIDLPDWITPDKETFVDGETVTFTIAANAPLFERMATLTAISDYYLGSIQATISFAQLYDTSTPPPPEFIEVDDETVLLGYPAGSNVQLAVSASGDYTITPSGAHTFAAVKENGGINLRVSESTANFSLSNRTGTIRLALVSNPAVFVDIAVTQEFRPNQMLTASPSVEQTIGETGDTFVIDITTLEATTQWQAVAVDPDSGYYLHFDAGLKTGSQSFVVVADGRPFYIPYGRELQIRFVNIFNTSDYVSFTVQQN